MHPFKFSNAPALRPVSSVYGRIGRVLLTLPSRGERPGKPEDVWKRFGGILEALNDRVEFLVLGNFAQGMDPEMAFSPTAKLHRGPYPGFEVYHLHADHPAGMEVGEPCHAHTNHNLFPQDAFIPLTDAQGKTYLVEPYARESGRNSLVADQLAAGTREGLIPTPYRLEGGNMLFGDDFAIAGWDTLEANRRFFPGLDPGAQEAAVTQALCELLGLRYLIWIGNEQPSAYDVPGLRQGKGFQPLYHLDLFATLAGKNAAGDEVVLVAELTPEGILSEDGENAMDLLQPLARDLDGIAAHLAGYHRHHAGPRFRVLRVPLGMAVNSEGHIMPFSFNNCLVEWYLGGIRRVYLPCYAHRLPDGWLQSFAGQLADLEERACRSFREAHPDFHITRVKAAFSSAAKQWGSLRCMVKVLRREHQI